MTEQLKVSSSPHIRHCDTTRGIMSDVFIALCPAAIFGCILFGIKAAVVIVTCIAVAVLSEFLWNKIMKKPQTAGDMSAAVTGLLLGMNLTAEVPFWVAAIGSIAAIIVVKQFFGGLGHNFVNPAIAARIILLVSFPTYMTTFYEPISKNVSSATPLAAQSTPSLKMLFFGMHAGSIGETSAFLLLIGGIYLVIRKVINPIIPLAFMGSLALCTLVSGGNPLTAILTGGVMLGSIFMATDYVTTPTMPLGKLIFGIGCGIITFVIRKFGSLPEGVSYSIIIMNILTPHINTLTYTKPFGFVKEVKKDA